MPKFCEEKLCCLDEGLGGRVSSECLEGGGFKSNFVSCMTAVAQVKIGRIMFLLF